MRLQFSEVEWLDVVRLPVVVFQAVALADGRADSGEQNCFLEYVQRTSHVDPLLKQICYALAEQGKDVLKLSEREQDYQGYLQKMRAILENRLSPGERRSFLAGLLCLGHHVAGASGGFWGLGNRVSAVELARLEEISALLDLPRLLNESDS